MSGAGKRKQPKMNAGPSPTLRAILPTKNDVDTAPTAATPVTIPIVNGGMCR